MAIESDIYDWLVTVDSNKPLDGELVNSGDAAQYTDLGEAFRDLKQVIRDQSISQGWGTLPKWKYIKGAADSTSFSLTNPTGATAGKVNWGTDDIIIKIHKDELVFDQASTASITQTSMDFTPGTMVVIYDDGASEKKWFCGYIQDTVVELSEAGVVEALYLKLSGVMKYTNGGTSLPAENQGLLPASKNDLSTLKQDDSLLLISSYGARLPGAILNGIPSETPDSGGFSARTGGPGDGINLPTRFNYSRKTNNWVNNAYPDETAPINTSANHYGDVVGVPNTPNRVQSGTFLMEQTPLTLVIPKWSDTTAVPHLYWPVTRFQGHLGKVAVVLPVPAPIGDNANPIDLDYPVFLTPVWVNGSPDPQCFMVKDIKCYVTGFTVEFVQALGTATTTTVGDIQAILWKWMVIRDVS
tara:strand:- start:472 stop:1710 length:1239 start_codon:yes stop_codon:yes gene_type:complete